MESAPTNRAAIRQTAVRRTATGQTAWVRRWQSGPLDRALVVIVVLGALVGVIELAAVPSHPATADALVAFCLVFWIWLATGVLAWWRRPSNGTGPLIVWGAIALCLGGLNNMSWPVLGTVSALFATTIFAVTVHLLHAFPSGRVQGRLSRGVVVAGYIVATGLDVVGVVLEAIGAPNVDALQALLGLAVMVTTAVVLARRLTATDRRHRRVLLPLSLYGIIAVLGVVIAPRVLAETAPSLIGIVQLVLLAGLPIAFALGIRAGAFTRTTALEALSAWLAVGGATRPAVERALRTTLGDDALTVVYWSAEREVFVDAAGATVIEQLPGRHRARVPVRVGGRLVGAIDYDSRITDDPRIVARAGDVLAIAIDRERLIAELTVSNDELMQSRRRIIEAAYGERTRIARDLHDGLQVQLVLLAIEAQAIAGLAPRGANVVGADVVAAAEHLRSGIDAAAAELRRLVHNVMPAPLRERGLVAAVEELVDRLEVPAALDADIDESQLSSATVHTAYFVVAELVTNAVKHAEARSVRVRIGRSGGRLLLVVEDDGVGGARVGAGAGLRGVEDRVEALQGAVEIVSPRRGGTRVGVELPCV